MVSVGARRETSRNVEKRRETSRKNIEKHRETSRNIEKHRGKTSRNIEKHRGTRKFTKFTKKMNGVSFLCRFGSVLDFPQRPFLFWHFCAGAVLIGSVCSIFVQGPRESALVRHCCAEAALVGSVVAFLCKGRADRP